MKDNIIPKSLYLGMWTKNPETKNSPNNAWLAWNMKITGNSCEPVNGFKQFANRLTSEGRIRDAYTFILRDGTEIPVRVRDDGTNNVVEWYETLNDTWYILLKQTKSLNTCFQDYNGSTYNYLIWGNGTDNYSVWTGNKTVLTEALAGGEVSVKVTDNTNFPASGTIIYNGTEIAYTAKPDSTTFTVASAHASAGADDGVAQAVDDSTYSGFAQSDIMISSQNRIYILHSGARLDYSKEGDALNFTSGANRADGGQEDFPIVGGRGTGLAMKDEYIFIFKDRTVILFKWDYPTNTTKTPNFKHIVVGDGQGAINHKGIANVYDEILYTTERGIKNLTKNLNTGIWQPGAITDVISETIKDYDFREASSFYDTQNDVFLCACKSDSDQTANNRVIAIWYFYMTDTNGGLQRTYGISVLDLTADCFFRYDGKLYFGSSMEPNCYELFTGNTRNGATLECVYTDNRNDYGKKSIKGAGLYYVDGFMKAGTTIKLKFIFDGGRTGTQEVEIPSTGDHISESTLNTLGSYTLGSELLGGLYNDASDLLPFFAVIELQSINFFDLQVERKIDEQGGYFKILQEGLVDPTENNSLTPNI